MKLYWLSWIQPTDDYRPIHAPPVEGIFGWWCTGEGRGGATLCAMVSACDEAGAKATICVEWPEVAEWRFCEERQSVALSDRFPLSDWMQERIDAVPR